MPTHNQQGFPVPDPDDFIVPSESFDDEDVWMLLNAYTDGEATEAEILRVQRLLGSDPRVAREFSFLQLTAESVREFGEVDPPASLTSAIYAATARRKTLLQRVAAWWSAGGSAFGPAPLRFGAAALASGVLALVLWSRFGSPQRPHEHSPTLMARQETHSQTIVSRGDAAVHSTTARPAAWLSAGRGGSGGRRADVAGSLRRSCRTCYRDEVDF